MPRLRRRAARPSFAGPLAAAAGLALVGVIGLGPILWEGSVPGGVLGEVGELSDAGPAAGRDDRQARLSGVRPRIEADALLRFSKDADPVQRIPPDPATLTGYRWPIGTIRITQAFGPARGGSRIVNGEPFHDGLDLATFCGDRILAAHDGVVLTAGRQYDDHMGWLGDLAPYYARLDARGLWSTLPIVVVVDDGNGYRSIYAHLSKVAVSVGQSVAAGTLLGWEGRTGRASGCHLHYGLFSPAQPGTMAIDPGVVERMLLPELQVARVDPMRVLPAIDD